MDNVLNLFVTLSCYGNLIIVSPYRVMMPENGFSSSKLLDSEGDLSYELERCLKHIFTKYCTPSVEGTSPEDFLTPPSEAYISPQGLDKWALDTNGEIFTAEMKEEIQESLNTTEDGNLTLKGFLELYQAQAAHDEPETWTDLEKHGFDKELQFSRKNGT